MRYPNEVVRDAYHKKPAMLQVICHILENYYFQFGKQLDLISVEDAPDFIKAIIACSAMDGENEVNLEAARRINEQFKRKDGNFTCILANPAIAQFSIYVTSPADLAELH